MIYLDNVRFTSALSAWVESRQNALANHDPIPPIPDVVGEGIFKIASNLAKRPNFANYTYDLVSEGVLDCLKYIHNFRPEKSNNGFAYTTQIVHHAFIRVIKAEANRRHRDMLYAEQHAEGPILAKLLECHAKDEAFQKYKATHHKPRKVAASGNGKYANQIRELLAQGVTNTKEIQRRVGCHVSTIQKIKAVMHEPPKAALIRQMALAGCWDAKTIAKRLDAKLDNVYQVLYRLKKDLQQTAAA